MIYELNIRSNVIMYTTTNSRPVRAHCIAAFAYSVTAYGLRATIIPTAPVCPAPIARMRDLSCSVMTPFSSGEIRTFIDSHGAADSIELKVNFVTVPACRKHPHKK